MMSITTLHREGQHTAKAYAYRTNYSSGPRVYNPWMDCNTKLFIQTSRRQHSAPSVATDLKYFSAPAIQGDELNEVSPPLMWLLRLPPRFRVFLCFNDCYVTEFLAKEKSLCRVPCAAYRDVKTSKYHRSV